MKKQTKKERIVIDDVKFKYHMYKEAQAKANVKFHAKRLRELQEEPKIEKKK